MDEPGTVDETTAASESRAARITAAAAERSLNQWPLLVVLAGLAASCVVLATGHWRRGAFAAGCAVLLAAVLRAVLPRRVAGLLAVRSRWFDTLVLLVCGAAMLVLTLVVPPSSPVTP
ncbi:DUF3017 domain-containing protein [Aestuariimicrobium ganziense]|uniref:DUF3017 domain-containing protein n=1 Tax=Aestuariimicrobium ganziense TaxID=2773677 RepID=UPI001941D2CF|nr:DUF3017 domain-containing protein [Aestuariimicrobium ganziense]